MIRDRLLQGPLYWPDDISQFIEGALCLIERSSNGAGPGQRLIWIHERTPVIARSAQVSGSRPLKLVPMTLVKSMTVWTDVEILLEAIFDPDQSISLDCLGRDRP